MPLPSRSIVAKLNQLSSELGWGAMSAKVIPFDNGASPCLLWESDDWRDMRLTFCAIQRELSRDQVNRRIVTFTDFQACVVSWEFEIYAGTLRFSLPPQSGILPLSRELSPLLHHANFKTVSSRRKLVATYPTTIVPKDNKSLRWRPTELEIVDGQIVVDRKIQSFWRRRLAQLNRRKTTS